MNISTIARVSDHKFVSLETQAERVNKYCAVLLGALIPISTLATHIVLSVFMLSWFLAGNLSAKLKVIWEHPVAKAFLFLFGIFVIGNFYSVAPLEDRIALLRKMTKLLYLPFLLFTLQ